MVNLVNLTRIDFAVASAAGCNARRSDRSTSRAARKARKSPARLTGIPHGVMFYKSLQRLMSRGDPLVELDTEYAQWLRECAKMWSYDRLAIDIAWRRRAGNVVTNP